MPPKKNQKRAVTHYNHVYRGCRDAVTTPQAGPNPPTNALVLSSDANGVAGAGVVFAPLGLTSAVLGSNTYTAGTVGNVLAPNLRTLAYKAADFQWYRVTRAKICAVVISGGNSIGAITLAGYADPMDIQGLTLPGQVAGPNTKTFPLASAAGKEVSVPFPIDSSWKKVSSVLSVPGNSYPFNAASPTSAANINTVSDLSFGAMYVRISGATASVPVASFYIDYDVEFKGPIDTAVNA